MSYCKLSEGRKEGVGGRKEEKEGREEEEKERDMRWREGRR